MRPNRWAWWFVRGFCLALSFCGLLNFAVNPFGYYSARWFRPLTWSSRAEKVALLRSAHPSALILGSSRTMKLAPTDIKAITQGTAFNACVDSARVEDLEGMYAYSKVVLRQPVRLIVLGVDLELFNEDFGIDDRIFAVPELQTRLSPTAVRRVLLQRVTRLISGDQFAASIQSVWLRMFGYPEPANYFDSDGLAHYRVAEAQKAAGTFKLDVGGLLASYDQRFDFQDIGPSRRELFEVFLKSTEADGTEVVAFLTPLHPNLITHLRAVRPFDQVRSTVMSYLEGLQASHKLFSIRDLTEITSFGGDPADFIDPAHVADENSHRIVYELLGKKRALQ